jgi:hypothetical protein
MKNVYRFLVGCIVCFFVIVLFGTIKEHRVAAVASYTRIPIEELLALPVPSEKQWSKSGSLASYTIARDSTSEFNTICGEWTSKLGSNGWVVRRSGKTVWEWARGEDRIMLSYAPFLNRTIALLMITSDRLTGPFEKQFLELQLPGEFAEV